MAEDITMEELSSVIEGEHCPVMVIEERKIGHTPMPTTNIYIYIYIQRSRARPTPRRKYPQNDSCRVEGASATALEELAPCFDLCVVRHGMCEVRRLPRPL